MLGRIAWYTTQGECRAFFPLLPLLTSFLFSYFFTCVRYITLKQQCKTHINTNFLAMISTYNRVLNIIEKILQDFVEEYQGIEKSLCDLVEGQERNMAQLERIGAMVK